MDSEYKAKIDRLLKLAEENNDYIRQVRKTQKTAQMWKAIYWVIVITFAVGGFYALKPYISGIANTYSSFTGGASPFQMTDVKQFQEILNEFKK